MKRIIRWSLLLVPLAPGLLALPILGDDTVTVIPQVERAADPLDPGFFFLEVALPATAPRGALYTCRVEEGAVDRVHVLRTRDSDGRYDRSEQGAPATRVEVTGRYARPGTARLALLARAGGETEALRVVTLAFELPAQGGEPAEVMRRWAAAERASLRASQPVRESADPFLSYWDVMASRKYGSRAPQEFRGRRFDREPPDLYSVFTGAAAIQESLQLEALGLAGSPARTSLEADVRLDELAPPAVPSHPFETMLAGRNPAVPRLSAFVPADQYGVFFASLAKEMELSDLLDEWGGNLLREIDARGQDFRIKERLAGQLCLEPGLLVRLFGDRVIGELAFTGRDPFLKEGTDLTVVFALKDRERFRKHLEGRYAEAVGSRGAARSEATVAGHPAVSVTTADRRVSSHILYLGDVAVVSNSLAALARAVEAASGALPALAGAAEFRYVSTLFPDGPGDAFAYLSDAHIRQLVGPRWKIGEARRMRCAGNLQLLGHARLWHRRERGAEPTLAVLQAEGALGERPLRCPDGGRYALDPITGEASCTVHNRLGLLTPVGDVPLEGATADEAAGYRRFAEGYTRYWRQFFDPIGIRIRLGTTIRVETVILPLIENSWYDGLAAAAGRTPGRLTEAFVLPSTVASLRARLSPEWTARFRRHGDERRGRPEVYWPDWLGSELSLNLCDGSVLCTLGSGSSRFLGRAGGRDAAAGLLVGYLFSSLNLPSYVAAEVTDPEAAERDLADLASLLPAGLRGLRLESYRLDPYRGKNVYVAALELEQMLKLRFFLAVANGRLLVASRPEVMTQLLDAAEGDKPATREGSAELSVYRDAFRALEPTVTLGYQERLRAACQSNLALAGVLLGSGQVAPEDLAAQVLTLRGYAPLCPSGGTYRWDPAEHRAACTVHGTAARPRQPRAADETSPTLKLVNRLRRVNSTLAFTPEGLRASLVVDRRPQERWWRFW